MTDLVATYDETDMLWNALEQTPHDETLKMALADKLREFGCYDLSNVLQWCIDNRRWPKRSGGGWHWTSGKTCEVPKQQTNVLPRPFYKLTYNYGRSARSCLNNLALMFTDLRDRGPKWSNQ